MKRLYVPALAGIALLGAALLLRWQAAPDPSTLGSLIGAGPQDLPRTVGASDPSPGDRSEVKALETSRAAHPTKELLQDFFNKYKEARKDRGHGGSTRFGHEERMHFLEARLLARSYPKDTHPLLLEMALDPTLSRYDKVFALRTLGALADEGYEEAKGSLIQLAYGNDFDTASGAVGLLMRFDKSGDHRELYFKRFVEGSSNALHALSLWPNSKNVAEISDLGTHPDDFMRSRSEMVMERFNILLSNNCNAKLEELITKPKGDVEWWTPWAVEAAVNRSIPGLESALRKRLDANSAAARTSQDLFRGPTQEGPDPYAVGDGGGEIVDPCHDIVLLAYYRLGGKLTTREQNRLRYHGYLGDPKKRLAEILA